ncbi:TPA: type II toxin-antitoxin system antitoxin DNA ADP-ribosyl glycohydrolase DarG [Vibrio diabolicus]
MIVYVKGDLLNDSADALVNAVNTVGVMGKGLAYQFKEKFPENFISYRKACKNKELTVGKVFTYKVTERSTPNFILNFPTKAHWRGKSKIEYIEEGLKDLVEVVKQHNIATIALPALGSGLGGLPWSQVERLIVDILGEVEDVEWRVYAPNNQPPTSKKLSLTAGRAALLFAFNSYMRASKKKQLTELEAQSLVYLLRYRGLVLNKLDFDEFRDVPFSPVLHDALKTMDGSLLYISGINKPLDKTYITLEPKVLAEANQLMGTETRQKKQIAEVESLISGYESKEGMAILSTALWTANIENNFERNKEEIVPLTLELMSRQTGVSEGLIKGAFARLIEEQWLPN